MTGLLDAFGRVTPVTLSTGTYLVPELTLGQLRDIQAWVCGCVPPPWDFPDPGDVEITAGMLANNARGWPPRVDTGEAEAAVGCERWHAHVLTVAPGLDDATAAVEAAWLATPDGAGARYWLRAAWNGESPHDLAVGLLERIVGKERHPDPQPPNWPRLVARICEGYGLSPADLMGLTQTALRTLCDRGEGRGGSFDREQIARVMQIRAKAAEWSRDNPPPPPEDAPGPHPTAVR